MEVSPVKPQTLCVLLPSPSCSAKNNVMYDGLFYIIFQLCSLSLAQLLHHVSFNENKTKLASENDKTVLNHRWSRNKALERGRKQNHSGEKASIKMSEQSNPSKGWWKKENIKYIN